MARSRGKAEGGARGAYGQRGRAPIARHLDAAYAGRAVAGQVIGGRGEGEPDLRGWLDGMRARGAGSPLPVIEERAAPLVFQLAGRGGAGTGGFGIQEPPASAPRVVPDVTLGRCGYRLGYGAGYFDRTLAAMAARRPLVIGVSFRRRGWPRSFRRTTTFRWTGS